MASIRKRGSVDCNQRLLQRAFGRGNLRRLKSAPYKSSLEADYAALLAARQMAGDVIVWRYESVTLAIGNGCRYTPDFMVVRNDGVIEMVEVKGRPREDGMIKLKVASKAFPEFRWLLVRRNGKTFHEEEL